MIKLNLLIVVLLLGIFLPSMWSQEKYKLCGSNGTGDGIFVDLDLMKSQRSTLDLPVVLNVYIHVVAFDDGSNGVTNMDSLLLQFELMRQHFAPHNICFILAGIGRINNTDLDFQYIDSEESELIPYLVPNMINVFIHDYLGDYPGGRSFGGNAYHIPNPYFSMWEAAVIDSNALTTFVHEMGHCLGLYHTHETNAMGGGAENVARTGTCKNCETAGDMLCDTPADPDLNDIVPNCTYSSLQTDACGELYAPDPQNIMSYAPGYCHQYFTIGQGQRALFFIENDPDLSTAITPSSLLLSGTSSINTGEHFNLAKNTITVSPVSYFVGGSAQMTFAAGDQIRFLPGVHFQPTSGMIIAQLQAVCGN